MTRRTAARILVLSLFATTVLGHDEPTHGHLMLIGGGDKPAAAMAKFVEVSGGPSAPIVVIPTASGAEDTPAYYLNLFKELGSTDVVVLPIRSKEDATRPELVTATARGRGFFFAGGDQSRITDALLGTPVLAAMREAHRNGAAIGGTSAGTACQSLQMITGEGDFKAIRTGAVEMHEGLGFLRGIIVDQHFIARQRENRLITVLLENPEQLGIGVDEDTAVWVKPDDTFEVIGASSAMVFDLTGSSVQQAPGPKSELLGVHGMRVHIILPGERFDLKRRVPLRATVTTPPASGVAAGTR